MIKHTFNRKLELIRVVTRHQGSTRAFSVRVLVTKKVVPTKQRQKNLGFGQNMD